MYPQIYNTCVYKCIYTHISVCGTAVYIWMDMPRKQAQESHTVVRSAGTIGRWVLGAGFRRELTHAPFCSDLSVWPWSLCPCPHTGHLFPEMVLGAGSEAPRQPVQGESFQATLLGLEPWTCHYRLCSHHLDLYSLPKPQFPYHSLSGCYIPAFL